MTQTEIERLQELRQKEQLTEKEFAQWEFLEKKVINDERIEQFRKNQQEPYSSKRSRAVNLAWEFFRAVEGRCYVAVGGLDSIVLYLFLRSIGIDVPAISVSSLEDRSIQKVHEALGVISLPSAKGADGKRYNKIKVIREFGWPVLSKEVAGKISLLQHPSQDNATVRHAIITGETGAKGGYQTGSKMQLRKWILQRFGGADLEGKALGYAEADFRVSDKCCYYLKEKPCDDYHRETGRWPYMGLMASEGGRREKALAVNGCNYISEKTKRSCPFATFLRQDILTLAQEMDAWYHQHANMFPGPALDTIVPAIYGEIRALLNRYCGYQLKDDEVILLVIRGIAYYIADITLRMLIPRELYNAMGFPTDYIIHRDYLGNAYGKTKQVARCGNAVCPPLAEAMVRANLPEWCSTKMETMEQFHEAVAI